MKKIIFVFVFLVIFSFGLKKAEALTAYCPDFIRLSLHSGSSLWGINGKKCGTGQVCCRTKTQILTTGWSISYETGKSTTEEVDIFMDFSCRKSCKDSDILETVIKEKKGPGSLKNLGSLDLDTANPVREMALKLEDVNLMTGNGSNSINTDNIINNPDLINACKYINATSKSFEYYLCSAGTKCGSSDATKNDCVPGTIDKIDPIISSSDLSNVSVSADNSVTTPAKTSLAAQLKQKAAENTKKVAAKPVTKSKTAAIVKANSNKNNSLLYNTVTCKTASDCSAVGGYCVLNTDNSGSGTCFGSYIIGGMPVLGDFKAGEDGPIPGTKKIISKASARMLKSMGHTFYTDSFGNYFIILLGDRTDSCGASIPCLSRLECAVGQMCLNYCCK